LAFEFFQENGIQRGIESDPVRFIPSGHLQHLPSILADYTRTETSPTRALYRSPTINEGFQQTVEHSR
jgi:hypothetical protein